MTIMGRDREATINLVQVFALGVFSANLASVILYYSGYPGFRNGPSGVKSLK